MPPKRRSAGGATSTRSQAQTQSTLSFNNKSRVTKQSNSLPPSETKHKSSAKRLSNPAEDQILDEISQTEPEPQPEAAEIKLPDTEPDHTLQEQLETAPAPRPRRKVKKDTGYENKVKEAEKLSDAKIKSYWKKEEDSRLAPRVHQKGIHLHEKILRHFDLSSQHGPCIGISRLNRWKRAFGLGTEPPIEVLAVLLKEDKKGADKGVGGRECGRSAYIDELANGQVVLVE